jgi:hypothetical protein
MRGDKSIGLRKCKLDKKSGLSMDGKTTTEPRTYINCVGCLRGVVRQRRMFICLSSLL